MVDFIWRRRGDVWAKLEKFEDVVQRQFEELRMSLVAHARHAQAAQQQQQHALAGGLGASPASTYAASLSPRRERP